MNVAIENVATLNVNVCDFDDDALLLTSRQRALAVVVVNVNEYHVVNDVIRSLLVLCDSTTAPLRRHYAERCNCLHHLRRHHFDCHQQCCSALWRAVHVVMLRVAAMRSSRASEPSHWRRRATSIARYASHDASATTTTLTNHSRQRLHRRLRSAPTTMKMMK